MSEKKHVLLVITSHDRLGDTGEPTGFWLEEVAQPYYEFVDQGVELTLASPRGGPVPIDPRSEGEDFQTDGTRRFCADEQAMRRIRETKPLAAIDAKDFDAVFFAGGHGTMWDFPEPAVGRLVEQFDRAGKPIASVCHGVAALTVAKDQDGRPLVANRCLTSFTNSEEQLVELAEIVPFLLESRLREQGAKFEAAADFAPHVVHDGALITGQNPASSGPAARAVIAALR